MIRPYKNRNFDVNKAVYVYRNLNKKGVVYSIKQDGKVIGHASELYLKNCVFLVNEVARTRVIRNQKREVHAYIKGFMCTEKMEVPEDRVSYRPFSFPTFIKAETEEPVYEAAYILVSHNGVFANL